MFAEVAGLAKVYTKNLKITIITISSSSMQQRLMMCLILIARWGVSQPLILQGRP